MLSPFESFKTTTEAPVVRPGGTNPVGKLFSSAPMKGGAGGNPPSPPPRPHEESVKDNAANNVAENIRRYFLPAAKWFRVSAFVFMLPSSLWRIFDPRCPERGRSLGFEQYSIAQTAFSSVPRRH